MKLNMFYMEKIDNIPFLSMTNFLVELSGFSSVQLQFGFLEKDLKRGGVSPVT